MCRNIQFINFKKTELFVKIFDVLEHEEKRLSHEKWDIMQSIFVKGTWIVLWYYLNKN